MIGIVAVVAIAIIFSRGGREVGDIDTAEVPPLDPGYAARDAVVIETGYDGRERYRLKAAVIRQQTESGVIDLEQLDMDYHRNAHSGGQSPSASAGPGEVWHRQVLTEGDDVELKGNVRVTGPAQDGAEPLSMTTDSLRVNTPTEFIETDSAVVFRWSGYELKALGMRADLKTGKLSLESDVNGHFLPK
jgi:LPS export ABC transporter protein LptC